MHACIYALGVQRVKRAAATVVVHEYYYKLKLYCGFACDSNNRLNAAVVVNEYYYKLKFYCTVWATDLSRCRSIAHLVGHLAQMPGKCAGMYVHVCMCMCTHVHTHIHTHTERERERERERDRDWACTTCSDFGFLFFTLFLQSIDLHTCLFTIFVTHIHMHTRTHSLSLYRVRFLFVFTKRTCA